MSTPPEGCSGVRQSMRTKGDAPRLGTPPTARSPPLVPQALLAACLLSLGPSPLPTSLNPLRPGSSELPAARLTRPAPQFHPTALHPPTLTPHESREIVRRMRGTPLFTRTPSARRGPCAW